MHQEENKNRKTKLVKKLVHSLFPCPKSTIKTAINPLCLRNGVIRSNGASNVYGPRKKGPWNKTLMKWWIINEWRNRGLVFDWMQSHKMGKKKKGGYSELEWIHLRTCFRWKIFSLEDRKKSNATNTMKWGSKKYRNSRWGVWHSGQDEDFWIQSLIPPFPMYVLC